MNKLTYWIKNHQVIAFFVITFAISWGLGFSIDATMKGTAGYLWPLAMIALCGPALAGIILTAVTNPRTRQGAHRAFWIAFAAAWALFSILFVAYTIRFNRATFWGRLGVFIIVLVAVLGISLAWSRTPAVRSYLSSLFRLRGVWGWALLALALGPGLVLLSIPISSLLGRQPITSHQFPVTGLALVGAVVGRFIYQFFFFNATGEEIGWRGFALPRLQALASPLVAILVLNFFWGPWHFFLWQAEGGRPIFSLVFWAKTYLELLPGTFIISWFYNRSKGSILVAGIAHTAANTTFAFFPNLDWTVFNLTVAAVALVLIVVDRMWKKLPADHPAVYREPALEAEYQKQVASERQESCQSNP